MIHKHKSINAWGRCPYCKVEYEIEICRDCGKRRFKDKIRWGFASRCPECKSMLIFE